MPVSVTVAPTIHCSVSVVGTVSRIHDVVTRAVSRNPVNTRPRTETSSASRVSVRENIAGRGGCTGSVMERSRARSTSGQPSLR